MGSITRWNSIDFYAKIYGNKIENYFEPLLADKKIESLSNVEVNYYVKGEVSIDNQLYPIHYRWAGTDESSAGKELDEHYVKLEEHFEQCLKGKTIHSIKLGLQDRDDEVYLCCFVDEEYDIEIPIGFDPEDYTFHGFSELLLTDEEQKLFPILREVNRIVNRWIRESRTSEVNHLDYLGTIAELIAMEAPDRDIAENAEKLVKMHELFQQQRIDSLDLMLEIKRLIPL